MIVDRRRLLALAPGLVLPFVAPREAEAATGYAIPNGLNGNDGIRVPPRIAGLWIPGDRMHGLPGSPGAIPAGYRATLGPVTYQFFTSPRGTYGAAEDDPTAFCNDPDGYCDPIGAGVHLTITYPGSFDVNVINISCLSRERHPEDWQDFHTLPAQGITIVGGVVYQWRAYNSNPRPVLGRPAPDPAKHATHTNLYLATSWWVEPNL